MRYVLGAVALAPFVLLLIAMVTGRADVHPCCPQAATADKDHREALDSAGSADPRA